MQLTKTESTFLSLIENDIIKNPNNINKDSLALWESVAELTSDVDINLNVTIDNQ